MSSHGTGEGVSLHRGRGEPLCEPCRVYLNRLQREAFTITPAEDVVAMTILLPRAAFYLLGDRAHAAGVTDEEYVAGLVVDTVRVPGRTLTFSQEKQIRARYLAGESTAAIARAVGVQAETVRRRITRWGGESNGRKTTHQKENP